jgi:hypothetical protein
MRRNPDLPALLLLTALLLGAIVRFYPALASEFPLNDGGMFYTMARDLKANGFALPHFTTYNHAGIPFAYPPFGLYAVALLSAPMSASDLWAFLYLPAWVNLLAIPAFYLLAWEILNSRIAASLAVLIFALAPRAFLWQVMGGGVTRAFGMLFLLLMLWQAAKLFRNDRHKNLFLTILFGAGAVTSHPQTALHAALGGALIFLFYGFGKRGFRSAIFTGLGVALLTAPWWGTALSRHGMTPFISAGQTSPRTLEAYLGILKFEGLGDYLFLPVLLLAFIGLWDAWKKREFFPPAWIALAYFVDPRGGDGIALLGLSMLAGVGMLELSAWISRSDGGQAGVAFARRGSQILLFGVILYSVTVAGVFDFQLVNTSLKAGDLAVIEWVNANVDDNKTFLLATGREYSMSDPMQEWFPALTGRKSATTMQGLEWSLGEEFFPWYGQLIAFQHCTDAACVNAWAERNGVAYDYLIVFIPDENERGGLANSLRSLGVSMRDSASHELVHESERAMVFALKR